MDQLKRHLGFATDSDPDDSWISAFLAIQADVAAPPADTGEVAALSAKPLVSPSAPVALPEPQLDGYAYGPTTIYGSNIEEAWRYTSGLGVTIGLVDDGFATAATATFGQFSTTLSHSFASGSSSDLSEPAGGDHGTTTSGLIGATGANGSPEGLAPNATIVGVKVDFSSATVTILAEAEAYAASVSSIVNNSWGYTGYGYGELAGGTYALWYAAVQQAVNTDRGGLGDVIIFAAGNDRADANSLAVQPIPADYQVIAVAASDADGQVAAYSTPGSALLVAAIADNVALVNTSGAGYQIGSGTSYSAPTVAAIAAMMLAVNPKLGWRDVQEILADAAYVPAPSASGFTVNAATDWNGGGMHFSNDLGFGVVDANVAVNLARAWTEQSASANMASATVTDKTAFTVGINKTGSGTVKDTADIRVQHVQVVITDTNLPVAWSKITLISPDGTASVLLDQVGLVGGTDQTGGMDISGDTLTSNAFWGENAEGTWTLDVQDIAGTVIGTIKTFSLTFLGDNAATVQTPLVYTPEFASLAAADPARMKVSPGTATTIDLIALPGTTALNLNGGAGLIDGVAVTIGHGLTNANADGSTGSVSLTGVTSGGSELTGGDSQSSLTGYGHDTINAGLGTSVINTGAGDSYVTLSSLAASTVTLTSGGGDTIYAGLATAAITLTGSQGDTVYDQSAQLTFINGSGASTLLQGSGTVTVQAGVGGGTYWAGTGGNSQLKAGTGVVTFYGAASGDNLTAAGTGADSLVAGAGTETLAGGASTGSITLQAGSGSDTMTAGKGFTTFIVGSGNSAIVCGGLASLIEVQDGHAGGLDLISDFRPGLDDLDLVGYGGQAVNSAIAGAKSDGSGGTLLTLSDHTRLDLLGLTKVTASAFG